MVPAWITDYPNVLSMALPKNSPYKPFLESTLFKFQEQGPWQLLRGRYEPKVPSCLEIKPDLALGMEKIFTLFFFVICGALAGVILLVIENVIKPESPAKVPMKRLRSLASGKPFFVDTALTTLQQLRAMTLPLENDADGILVKMDDVIHALEVAKSRFKSDAMLRKMGQNK